MQHEKPMKPPHFRVRSGKLRTVGYGKATNIRVRIARIGVSRQHLRARMKCPARTAQHTDPMAFAPTALEVHTYALALRFPGDEPEGTP